jgi:peroxiredoxin Q/BCP
MGRTPHMKQPVVKDQAPEIALPDQNGRPIRLSDLKGKKNAVLIFYPGDMTPGCTLQLCSLRDEWPKIIATGTAVFGINHADAESHTTFRKKYDFPFPLLIDAGKKVSAAYGAVRELFGHRVIRRTVVVVDKEGTIAYIKHGMPKTSDILKVLNVLAK